MVDVALPFESMMVPYWLVVPFNRSNVTALAVPASDLDESVTGDS
jgi:hypothetical protein